MSLPPRRIPEREARALWERALEMQLEALKREEQARLAATEGGGSDEDFLDPSEGFRLEDVSAAALEAGIAPEHLQMAIAELSVTEKQRRWQEGRGGRGARRLLPDQPTAIEISRVIRASPSAVLEAVRRVFPSAPYQMTLEDSTGDDPLVDGVLVFRLPGMQVYTQGVQFGWDMACATATHLLVSIRPEGEGGSRVTLRAPLLEHTRQSYLLGLVGTGVLGFGGGAMGLAVGLGAAGGLLAGLPAVLAAAVVAGAAALGGGGGTAMGIWGSRAAYRWGIGKGRDAMESLIKTIDVSARTGGAFPAGLPPAPSGGGADPTLPSGG